MRDLLRLVPVTREQAYAFIAQHHRHHPPPPGDIYRVGIALGSRPVGVAVAGRPVSRVLDSRGEIEVTRVATIGTPNASSMLYGACWKVARGLGYATAITYTEDGESGASLRAAGWLLDAVLDPRQGWVSRAGRTDAGAGVGRKRWRIRSGAAWVSEPVIWPVAGFAPDEQLKIC